MPRGRKKIPTAIQELRGAYKKDPKRRNQTEPVAPKEKPRCPSHLDATAKAEWKFLTGILDELGVLSRADKTALVMYCQSYSEWRKAADMCQQYGAWQVKKDSKGELITKRHEWDRIREQTQEACRKWLIEFGLTPSARSRLTVEKPVQAIQDINARKR
jgi:P27 family predicted phage terminase small subunit